MAKSPPSKTRLFLALELPAATREQLAGLLVPAEGLRPVGVEALHVTLVFLGWTREEEVDRIASLAADTGQGQPCVSLVPTRVRGLPPRSPRLFALDLEDPEGRCGALQGELSSALTRAGLYRPETRPFWPHVTLARVRRGRRVRRVSRRGDLPPAFRVQRVVLFRSTLRAEGARYDALAASRLKP